MQDDNVDAEALPAPADEDGLKRGEVGCAACSATPVEPWSRGVHLGEPCRRGAE